MVGEIKIKAKLSPGRAGTRAELGNELCSDKVDKNHLKISKVLIGIVFRIRVKTIIF